MIRTALLWLLLAVPATAFPVERCVNLSNALEEGEINYRIRDQDIAAIAREGFDTIRLPVQFSAWMEDGEIDPVLLERVDHVIRMALDEGLNVILDLHHFRALIQDTAAHTDTFVAIWSALARHYADWPDALMFELLNEARDPLETSGADDLFDQVIPIIRQSNPERWIILGPGDANHMNEVKELKPRDDRVAFTFHYYYPFFYTHQEAEWVKPKPPPKRGPLTAEETAEIAAQFERLPSFDRPVLLGEFGVYHKVVAHEERAIWTRAVREAAERAGIGWCHWGYASGFRVVSDEHTWLPGLRGALFD